MRLRPIIASLAIHAAVIGTMAGFSRLHPRQSRDRELQIPILFEIVEEALPSVSGEQPGPVPEEDAGADPEYDAVTAPEDGMGTVPEDEGTAPEENAEQMEDTGTVPGENSGNSGEAIAEAEEIPIGNDGEEHAKIVSDPVALNRIVPAYPRSARRKGHEGRVTVEILVAEDGSVSEAQVVSSSGHAELDSAALGAVRTAEFAPATEDGAGVAGRLRLTFDFRLE